MSIGVPLPEELTASDMDLDHSREVEFVEVGLDIPAEVDFVDEQVVKIEQDAAARGITESVKKAGLRPTLFGHFDVHGAVFN